MSIDVLGLSDIFGLEGAGLSTGSVGGSAMAGEFGG